MSNEEESTISISSDDNDEIEINNVFIINNNNELEYKYLIPYDPYITFLFENYNIHYKKDKNKYEYIHFKCDSIQSLNEFIMNNGFNYNTIIKLIYDTGILIKNLEEERRGIFCFSLDDFIVINNNIFLFTNILKVSSIYKNQLTLKIPININEQFIDKDNTNNINFSQLPIKSYYTHSYYSFGLMVFYLFTKERYSEENKSLLNQIYQTPLYYFLLRCLNANPQERYYLYI